MSDKPYFAFEGELKPLPVEPTHCTCGVVLEPLRRHAGLCKRCVLAGSVSPPAPTDALRSKCRFIRTLRRRRKNGHHERFVEVQCSCGRKRILQWKTWIHHRPKSCNRCRLKDVEAHGFEAEYAR